MANYSGGRYDAMGDTFAKMNDLLLNQQAFDAQQKQKEHDRALDEMMGQEQAVQLKQRADKARHDMEERPVGLNITDANKDFFLRQNSDGKRVADRVAQRITGDPTAYFDEASNTHRYGNGKVFQTQNQFRGEVNNKIVNESLIWSDPDKTYQSQLNDIDSKLSAEEAKVNELETKHKNLSLPMQWVDPETGDPITKEEVMVAKTALKKTRANIEQQRADLQNPENRLRLQEQHRQFLESTLMYENLDQQTRQNIGVQLDRVNRKIGELEPMSRALVIDPKTGKSRMMPMSEATGLVNKNRDTLVFDPRETQRQLFNSAGQSVPVNPQNAAQLQQALNNGFNLPYNPVLKPKELTGFRSYHSMRVAEERSKYADEQRSAFINKRIKVLTNGGMSPDRAQEIAMNDAAKQKFGRGFKPPSVQDTRKEWAGGGGSNAGNDLTVKAVDDIFYNKFFPEYGDYEMPEGLDPRLRDSGTAITSMLQQQNGTTRIVASTYVMSLLSAAEEVDNNGAPTDRAKDAINKLNALTNQVIAQSTGEFDLGQGTGSNPATGTSGGNTAPSNPDKLKPQLTKEEATNFFFGPDTP